MARARPSDPVYIWTLQQVAITFLPGGVVYQCDENGVLLGRFDTSGTWIEGVDPADVDQLVAAGYAQR